MSEYYHLSIRYDISGVAKSDYKRLDYCLYGSDELLERGNNFTNEEVLDFIRNDISGIAKFEYQRLARYFHKDELTTEEAIDCLCSDSENSEYYFSRFKKYLCRPYEITPTMVMDLLHDKIVYYLRNIRRDYLSHTQTFYPCDGYDNGGGVIRMKFKDGSGLLSNMCGELKTRLGELMSRFKLSDDEFHIEYSYCSDEDNIVKIGKIKSGVVFPRVVRGNYNKNTIFKEVDEPFNNDGIPQFSVPPTSIQLSSAEEMISRFMIKIRVNSRDVNKIIGACLFCELTISMVKYTVKYSHYVYFKDDDDVGWLHVFFDNPYRCPADYIKQMFTQRWGCIMFANTWYRLYGLKAEIIGYYNANTFEQI